MESYQLLKELPDLKAGAIFDFDEKTGTYILTAGTSMAPKDKYWFDPITVEQSPEWFRKIVLPLERKEFSWANMISFAQYVHGSDCIYEINQQRHIPIDALLVDKWIALASPKNEIRN